jgi:hypothetical protein
MDYLQYIRMEDEPADFQQGSSYQHHWSTRPWYPLLVRWEPMHKHKRPTKYGPAELGTSAATIAHTITSTSLYNSMRSKSILA